MNPVIWRRAVPGLTRDLFETVQEVPGQARDVERPLK